MTSYRGDTEVVLDRLEQLFRIGGLEGACRLGLTPEEREAQVLVENWMQEAGLETSFDGVGNLYGRLIGRRPDLPEIWCGSHLDTVPNGGRFDGALGVIGALAAVSSIREQAERTMTVVAFVDEEGVRFGSFCLGSRALANSLPLGALELRDRDGVSVREALGVLGRRLADVDSWLVPRPGAFVELHIEQGPALAAQDASIGIVESIVGMLQLEVTFEGQEGHAGTVPLDARRDAGASAAIFMVDLDERARAIPGAVATVGSVVLEPGASNVIPRKARLAVDARAPDTGRLASLQEGVTKAAAGAAAQRGCTATVRLDAETAPVAMDPSVSSILRRAAPGSVPISCGAGHDAQVLGLAGTPVGMMLVRSLAGGISHSPLELTSADDIDVALGALSTALKMLARA